ncbi:MAG: hypothetical protein IT373_25320 [Polyangiaceae bacterium]|nr:hypothetical protein [Polyangiaceae bacterium]
MSDGPPSGSHAGGARPVRVAGCDLGKAAAKLVVATFDGGTLRIDDARVVPHEGRPLPVFTRWYRELDVAACAALGATGVFADELVLPGRATLPEDACLEAALALHAELAGPLGLVSVGARGYAVLARAADGRVTYLENDKCSSGTGETMQRIAGRFGVELAEADRLAAGAARALSVSARCSVFAKSELTHFANQGRPADELLRGSFESVARHVAALVQRAGVDGPLYLVGGCSRVGSFARALAALVPGELRVPEAPLFFEATGAARLAALGLVRGPRVALPRDPEALHRPRPKRLRELPPARASAGRVTELAAPPVLPGAERAPSILGLDIGSTGSKAVLTSLETGEAVLDVYDRTRGNPIDAAGRLLGAILAHAPDVRAVGVTGSGREAVATLLRAALPEAEGRVVVVNEIVAHATAAIRCDEAHGRSLSIVEIGGQDAKFVQIVDGQIVASDMNKACSAGTGSFLEEQALLYGIPDVVAFGRLCEAATRPPELGQMCSVFVADAAAEAEAEGFSLADVCAGFEYAVIHNYKNRVMGARTFGERVFFQGKPASGRALAWTLAAVTGRDVIVPPNPGAMGAWGIGLCARADLGADALAGAAPLALERVLAAHVVERGAIRCQDKRCDTLCPIDRTVVAVGAERRTVYTGGACPKFEVASGSRPKLPIDAPSAFDAREALLAPYRQERPGRIEVELPEVGALVGLLPFLTTFLATLGVGVRVRRAGPRSLGEGEERCYSFDACAPVKLAHAIVDGATAALFFPKILGYPDREGPGGATCAMEQALPEVAAAAARARGRAPRLAAPRLDLRLGPTSPELLAALGVAAAVLGADVTRVPAAARAAFAAQQGFVRALRVVGDETLAYARRHDLPVVVVCGALHVLFDATLNAGVPSILRQSGVLPLPMDAFPLDAAAHPLPRVPWADANRALRVALGARARGDVYPLWLSSFGCGPSSFVEHAFAALSAGHPHTALESDGHGGAAGYVTRVEAFLHTVRRHDRQPSRAPAAALRALEPLVEPPIESERAARLVVPSMGARFTPVYAACYRSFGFDAVAAGPNTADTLAVGRRDCSGKECLPYQFLWGAFRTEIERERARANGSGPRRLVLLEVSGDGACRNCMFSVKDELALAALGAGDRVGVRHVKPEPELSLTFSLRLFAAIAAWDVLNQLAAYHAASEPRAGAVKELLDAYCDELAALVGRPSGPGRAGLRAAARDWPELGALLERASAHFAWLPDAPAHELRTVLLTGDVYLRFDEHGSGELVRELAARGLRVLVEPLGTMFEYLAAEGSADLFQLPQSPLANAGWRVAMQTMTRSLYGRVRPRHPWLRVPDVAALLAHAREHLARSPVGEAPITLGSALSAWRERACDGIVVVGPWGCGPALVAESLLKHEREIPLLFVYADGAPLDERRLDGFAFKLRRDAPRGRGETAPSSHERVR